MTSFSGEMLTTGAADGATPPQEGGFTPLPQAPERQHRLAQPTVESTALGQTVEVDVPSIDAAARAREQALVDKIMPEPAPALPFNPFKDYGVTEPKNHAALVAEAQAHTPATYALGAYSTSWTDM